MQVDDPDGFVDRQLFDFPLERDVYLGDLKVPIPADVPGRSSRYSIYTSVNVFHQHNLSGGVPMHMQVIMENHEHPQVYTFGSLTPGLLMKLIGLLMTDWLTKKWRQGSKLSKVSMLKQGDISLDWQ